jgi:hypothetical protein
MATRLILVLLVLASLSLAEAGVYQLRTGLGYKNPSGGTIAYTNVSTTYVSDGRGYGAARLTQGDSP